jgi:hypothetical protein
LIYRESNILDPRERLLAVKATIKEKFAPTGAFQIATFKRNLAAVNDSNGVKRYFEEVDKAILQMALLI